jgi:inner membrane protein
METAQTSVLNLLERFNRWIQESIMIKLFSIGFLILILMLPSSWIESLMYERQQRADDVIDEVAEKWSGSQTLSGPVLVIPYRKQVVVDKGKSGKEVTEYIERAFFLPDQLNITGSVTPEVLHRGIFDAVVYESALKVDAAFTKPDFKTLSVADEMVLWKDASLVFGISDLGGISDNPVFMSGEKALEAEPSNNIGVPVSKAQSDNYAATVQDATHTGNLSSVKGIVAKLGWENAGSFTGKVNMKLNVKGSRRLDFTPTGKTTNVTLSGAWNNPSFDGEFLPTTREITESNFSASWKVLHFNRPFAQQWTGDQQVLQGADFGVKLLIPVDQYQKSIRTSKYGILVILLTFMALFLVEITQKIRIHPFQYILIGATLIIYYTLLLSFSEHVGYNLAYIISSAATVLLVSAYATTFVRSTGMVLLLSVLLIVFYAFIYIIILQQDSSLLLGSIGLFFIVGAIMYFSRKVKWYKESPVPQ